MALFRRGKNSEPAPEAQAAAEETAPAKQHGPWDVSEVDGLDGRLDLGSLWLPGINGMELRLEIDQTNGSVVGATVAVGESALQLQAFAAPRTLGIWDDIRDEIVDAIRASGGVADVVEGPFGNQINAHLAQVDPAGQSVMAPVVFFGVDGPRWFLRGFLSGPAVSNEELVTPMLALFADTVVVRGSEAMAPRDLLPLRMPADLGQAPQAHDHAQPEPAAEPEQPQRVSDLNPFERGPEITEVR